MITCIYKISNSINGRIYIGSSIDFRLRKNRHITHLNRNIHCNKKLQRFVNKYGVDVLIFSIIEECHKDELLLREQYYIDLYQSFKYGFNILPTAGSWLNKKHKASSIAKQSAAKKGKATTTGMKLSEEAKEKIRRRAIGRKQSAETIQKRVQKNKGKKRSELAKQKVVEKLRKLSDAQVLEIKGLLRLNIKQVDIARKFGVCQRNICRINQGISYSHVKVNTTENTLF